MTPQKAKAIWAIYVWCRRTDELVDGPNASRITPAVRLMKHVAVLRETKGIGLNCDVTFVVFRSSLLTSCWLASSRNPMSFWASKLIPVLVAHSTWEFSLKLRNRAKALGLQPFV